MDKEQSIEGPIADIIKETEAGELLWVILTTLCAASNGVITDKLERIWKEALVAA
jgi:hypothetical protein